MTEIYNREKSLRLYISGLECGDFDQMGKVLEQAQTDPVLEQMITEAHEVYDDMPPLNEEDYVMVGEMIKRIIGGSK